MKTPVPGDVLPIPAGPLSAGGVTLRFDRIKAAMPERGFVPAYQFHILLPGGAEVGHLSFRVGDTDHVRLIAGHLGYAVAEPYRGHGFARHACLAAAPLIRRFDDEVIITCDPDNVPSRRTIEHLGATFIEDVSVPPDDPHYARGSRWKRRYSWKP